MKLKVETEILVPDGTLDAVTAQLFRSMNIGLRTSVLQVESGQKEATTNVSYQGCFGTIKARKVSRLETIAEVIDAPSMKQRRANPAR